MFKPLIVALCGVPLSGKSEVQKVLQERFDIIPQDDGDVIRQHCMEMLELTEHDVMTQEGKRAYTTVQGVKMQNRKILGEYGNALENLFGNLIIPNIAIRKAKALDIKPEHGIKGYSFGSVRRGQGEAYIEAGGIVIEIVKPGVVPTGNIWDTYDQQWVTNCYVNSKNNIEEMRDDFTSFFENVLKELEVKQ